MTVLKIMRTGSDPAPSNSPKSKNWLFHENRQFFEKVQKEGTRGLNNI
jgi:hypothetical protein